MTITVNIINGKYVVQCDDPSLAGMAAVLRSVSSDIADKIQERMNKGLDPKEERFAEEILEIYTDLDDQISEIDAHLESMPQEHTSFWEEPIRESVLHS